MRKIFGKTIVKLAEKNDKIVLLTGDVEQEMEEFKLKFPEVAHLILEADSRVDEEMINKAKDKECW